MAEIKWIKLYVDMFDHKKIKFIRKLPEGNDILLCWVMLLTSAGKCNTGGYIFLTSDIPYTAEMLADEFNMSPNTVRLALETFRKLKMINLDDNGIHVKGWDEYQNIDGMDKVREQNRERFKRHYDNKKEQKLQESNVRSNVSITQPNATEVEVEVDLELEVEVDKEVKSSSRPPQKTPESTYQENIGLITPIIAESISHWLKDGIEESLINRYIEVACKRNKRNWAYIEKMIQGNAEDGIKTLQQYDALNLSNQQDKGKKQSNPSNSQAQTESSNPFTQFRKEQGW